MIVDLIGLVGVFIIVVTYFLLQIEKIDPRSFAYSFLNAFGSLLIIYSLTFNWNLASFVIEFFWILISLYGLWKWWKNKRKKLKNKN